MGTTFVVLSLLDVVASLLMSFALWPLVELLAWSYTWFVVVCCCLLLFCRGMPNKTASLLVYSLFLQFCLCFLPILWSCHWSGPLHQMLQGMHHTPPLSEPVPVPPWP